MVTAGQRGIGNGRGSDGGNGGGRSRGFSLRRDIAQAAQHGRQALEVGIGLRANLLDGEGIRGRIGLFQNLRLGQHRAQAAQAHIVLAIEAEAHQGIAAEVGGVALDDDVSGAGIGQLHQIAIAGRIVVHGIVGFIGRQLRELFGAVERDVQHLRQHFRRDAHGRVGDEDAGIVLHPVDARQIQLIPDEPGVVRRIGDLALNAHIPGKAVQHGDHALQLLLRGFFGGREAQRALCKGQRGDQQQRRDHNT